MAQENFVYLTRERVVELEKELKEAKFEIDLNKIL